jgi:hypothetical protein
MTDNAWTIAFNRFSLHMRHAVMSFVQDSNACKVDCGRRNGMDGPDINSGALNRLEILRNVTGLLGL